MTWTRPHTTPTRSARRSATPPRKRRSSSPWSPPPPRSPRAARRSAPPGKPPHRPAAPDAPGTGTRHSADARARWAPAYDARWLAQADLLQVGRVWGAAAPYADADPEAASALRRAEDRLRTCTPTRWPAMTGSAPREPARWRRCGRRRACSPAAARAPWPASATRPGSGPTRPVPGPTLPRPPARVPRQPGPGQDLYQDAEQRGLRIAERLQARALAERGSRLSPDELATALEASTSLPAEVISRLARARSDENIAARAERARAADLDHAAASHSARQRADALAAAGRDTMIADTASAHASADRTAAQLAAESFPYTTADGIRAAVNGRLQQPAPSPARTAAVHNAPRPGLAP